MPGGVRAGGQPHRILAGHVLVGGQPKEIVRGWRLEGGTPRLVYERITGITVTLSVSGLTYIADTGTFTGQVTDVRGRPLAGVAVQMQVTTPGSSFGNVASGNGGTAVTDSQGRYTMRVQFNVGGPRRIRVHATPPHPFSEAWSPEVSRTLRPRRVGSLNGTSPSNNKHRSAVLTWATVPGATEYQVYNGNTRVKTVTGTSSGTISVSESRQYNWRVRARYRDATGTWHTGDFSPYLYLNTGRPEKRDSGSREVRVGCVKSGSWRANLGWTTGYHVRQGRWSAASNPNYYYGVADYGNWGVKNAIVKAIGSTRYSKGSANGGYTKYFRRGDVGRNTHAKITIRATKGWGSGGPPTLMGSSTTKSGVAYNSWNTHNLSNDVLNRLARQTSGARGLVVVRNNEADYSALNRHTAGSQDFDLWITWKWNYVSQSYIAPRWWR